MDKYISLDPNSFLHQSGKVYLPEYCGGWSVMLHYYLALISKGAGQDLWLLQLLFSHNKSWCVQISISYMIQTHSCPPIREGLFAGALCWLMHLPIVWHSTAMWQGSIFACFSQCYQS